MNVLLQQIGYNTSIQYQNRLKSFLSSYTQEQVNENGKVTYLEIKDSYFFKNDIWDLKYFEQLPQFTNQSLNNKVYDSKLCFNSKSIIVRLELKCIFFNKLFSGAWKLASVQNTYRRFLNTLCEFLDDVYPNLDSLIDLDIKKVKIQWIDWLSYKGRVLTRSTQRLTATYEMRQPITLFLENVYYILVDIADTREEFEKDMWDVRNLSKYGVKYNKSTNLYYIDFNKINNYNLRIGVKKYIKDRLINNNNFSWSSARSYMLYIPKFINFICELEPNWDTLQELSRSHIEKFLEWLNIYCETQLKQKNANPNKYKIHCLSIIQKFISDLQINEYDIAPKKSIRILILPSDKPVRIKKSYDSIDYIPDYVLEQLFKHINDLPSDTIPIVWILYHTGLRISDVLELKQDCLIKINNEFWIETDIEKTYIKSHRIPITSELADIIAVLIHQAKQSSNGFNNPDKLIFVRYSGPRKGKPYIQKTIQEHLNKLAITHNITDELGNIYHFKNHAFRHTYAIKMLNGGADILTVQDLLAHASPEMTLTYAKLLDNTKRKAFNEVHKTGIFSFQKGEEILTECTSDMSEDILNMLWTNHKLNAIDTPYGTCLQRANGKCQFAKQPPCLTCNGGEPCKDLCIGAYEGDIDKYKILIQSTKSLVESAKNHQRDNMVKENEALLNIFEQIHSKISTGNIIYGRLDRLRN